MVLFALRCVLLVQLNTMGHQVSVRPCSPFGTEIYAFCLAQQALSWASQLHHMENHIGLLEASIPLQKKMCQTGIVAICGHLNMDSVCRATIY